MQLSKLPVRRHRQPDLIFRIPAQQVLTPDGAIASEVVETQYASGAYRDLLAAHGVTGSMSRRGYPYDKGKPESFTKTLEVRFVYLGDV